MSAFKIGSLSQFFLPWTLVGETSGKFAHPWQMEEQQVLEARSKKSIKRRRSSQRKATPNRLADKNPKPCGSLDLLAICTSSNKQIGSDPGACNATDSFQWSDWPKPLSQNHPRGEVYCKVPWARTSCNWGARILVILGRLLPLISRSLLRTGADNGSAIIGGAGIIYSHSFLSLQKFLMLFSRSLSDIIDPVSSATARLLLPSQLLLITLANECDGANVFDPACVSLLTMSRTSKDNFVHFKISLQLFFVLFNFFVSSP